MRRSLTTRLPTASTIRRAWRLRPSRRTISISRSLIRLTSAGAVGPSSSSTPSRRRRSSALTDPLPQARPVGLRHFVFRVRQLVRQRAVVGQQQEAGRVGVEPPHRVEARLRIDQLDDRLPLSRLARRRDDSGGLVHHPDLEGLGAYGRPVDPDVVALVDVPRRVDDDLAADRDDALGDDLLGFAAGGDAAVREVFGQPHERGTEAITRPAVRPLSGAARATPARPPASGRTAMDRAAGRGSRGRRGVRRAPTS